MWHRDVSNESMSDANFAEKLLRDSVPDSCRLWLDCDGTSAEYAEKGVRYEADFDTDKTLSLIHI